LLSGRYRTDDHLWFAFFHELGHLVLHQRHKTNIEMTGNRTMLEDEADKFAQDAIVPPERWLGLSSLLTNPKSIARFAASLGVSRGLIVGQLQHIGKLPHSELNWMKRRFQWTD
jgi:Zn-dependent peptidase ImmA (M78 family)